MNTDLDDIIRHLKGLSGIIQSLTTCEFEIEPDMLEILSLTTNQICDEVKKIGRDCCSQKEGQTNKS